ncbi:dioxygenase [Ilyonectria destructans]|nr:dioxygenase [Ilyonectria destructans]
MKLSTILYSVALISSQAAAHPHHDVSPALAKRHSNLSKRCAAGAASLNEKRYQRRNKMKRDLEQRSGNATYEITTEAPYYQVIQNDTCVLTPDVTAGPYYWPRSETLRQDIYSSFTGRDPNTGFPDLLNELNITDFAIGETDLHTDDTTWLRGMWPTNEDGMMEMKTVFPGFYIERTIHVHAQVYTDWVLHSNGTISSGNAVSTGQLYFSEPLSEQLMALEPYTSHTEIDRTTNDVDTVFSSSTDGGYNPVFDVVATDGENVENGMIGYITIGVDSTAVDADGLSLN